MHICNIAFDAFFDDVKQLVSEGIRKDIKLQIASASQQSQNHLNKAIAYGKIREDSLVSWMDSKYPLAYGQDGGDETFRYLIRAVVPNKNAIKEGLPNWSQNSIAPLEFVDDLFDMSCPSNPIQPTAPVLQTGSFLPVLKIAHTSILALLEDSDHPSRQKFLKRILREALRVFHVHFFPFHLPNSGVAGSPFRKPVFNSWANLGSKDSAEQIPLEDLTSLLSDTHILPESVASKKAIANDCNADWYSSSLTLKTLKDVLNKTSLPSDFGKPTPSQAEYVNRTYRWVRLNYNGANPLHHLALIVGIIVASTFLPNLFIPTDCKHLFKNAISPSEVRNVYNSLDWLKKPKKGMKRKPIFVSMFTTFIIAIYDERSPLRVHMASKKLKGLGDAWTTKHSTFSFSLFLFSSCFPFLAMKGVTMNTLIRLNILWGSGTGAYDRGTFGKTWGCFDSRHLVKLHKDLCKRLSNESSPFGPFDSLSLLIGDKNARFFAKRNGFPYRPRINPNGASPSYVSRSDQSDVIVIDD